MMSLLEPISIMVSFKCKVNHFVGESFGYRFYYRTSKEREKATIVRSFLRPILNES